MIRAAFAAPLIDGMDHLSDAIGEMFLEVAAFDKAYSLVIAAGDVQAITWIKFCVQCATRFDDPPEESEFLSVLGEFSQTRWRVMPVGVRSNSSTPCP